MNGNAGVCTITSVEEVTEQQDEDLPDHPPAPAGNSSSFVNAKGVLLSEECARTVFDAFRNDSSFVWEYLEEGCLARAHKMCQTLSGMGVYSEKIRMENANGTWLRPFGLIVRPADAQGESVNLRFHVAVVVRVRTADGVEERIIDPSFADGPIRQEEWAKIFINADSISGNKRIDYSSQQKEYRRFPHDVFDTALFWPNKDPDLKLTTQAIAALQNAMSPQ